MSFLTPGRKAGLWILSSLFAFLAVEALVFRSGWYNRYLEPNSAAGSVELQLYWLDHFRPRNLRETLVVGDSRVAEGFSGRQANETPGNFGKRFFWNLGMPGTSPRVWYYILRDADPTRRRFENVVVALSNFADLDFYESQADRMLDLNFAIGRIGIADVWDFASSIKTAKYRREAIFGGLLKGSVFRKDVQEFLQDTGSRLASVKENREHGLDWNVGYSGNDHNLLGLSADWQTRTLHFPPGVDDNQRNTITDMLMPALPAQTGEMTRYRMRWLGRIVDLYRKSPTRVIFVQLPRAPLPQPPSARPTTFVDWARKQPNVSVMDAATFQYLESPEFFFDGFHMNRTGRGRFSNDLANRIPEILARK